MPARPRVFAQIARKAEGQRWRAARWRLHAERVVLARTARPRTRVHGRVLAYHSTGTPEWGVNDVTPGHFVAQLELAARLGYRFVSADAVAAGQAGARDLAITFDDGLRSILAVTPFLQARGVPFTVFVVSDWASAPGERFLSWAEVERLAAGGATIGSHSRTHANFRALDERARAAELEGSAAAIAQQLGTPPSLFAIPFGRSRDWDAGCTAMARAAGYQAVFAQAERRRPRGTVGRSFITACDGPRQLRAVLAGRFDDWEEWY